ncbi:MAG TPA: isochorismatase family protein [Desulfobacterales bacterium]|nr:isochorismatase family protein [Desulfobacterales bacterium]
MDVLLVIDMQKALFSTPRFDSEGVVNRINMLAEKIRKGLGKVIYIQHNGSEEEGLLPQSKGWQLLDNLYVDENDLFVTKTTCDSFYNTDLQEKLAEFPVKRVIITGCATDFCVDTTIRAAASKNYSIVVVKDGHTTGDRPHLDAVEIIEHHNWVWENLIVPKTEIKVVPTTTLLE